MGAALSATRTSSSSRMDIASTSEQASVMQSISSADSIAAPVSVLITWAHDGHMVYVTGAWDDWITKTPLRRAGPADPFTAVLSMPVGVHQYKYIVDGNWMHNKSLPTSTDTNGNLNNIIDVRPHRPEFDDDGDDEAQATAERLSPPSSFDYSIIPREVGRGEPPDLPAFLTVGPPVGERIPASTAFVRFDHLQTSRLVFRNAPPHVPPPQEDYCTMAHTKRYKTKVITTVLVSPNE